MQLKAEVEWYIGKLEAKFDYCFPEGYNNELRFMGHLQVRFYVCLPNLSVQLYWCKCCTQPCCCACRSHCG